MNKKTSISHNRLSPPVLVIQAAGLSVRMGGIPKGILPLGQRPWLGWHLENFKELGGSKALVVVGPHNRGAYEDVLKADKGIPGLCVRVLVNHDYEKGPFSSLLRAAEELSGEFFSSVLVQPVDGGLLSFSVFHAISLTSLANSHFDAIVPVVSERGGHPVWLHRRLFLKLGVYAENLQAQRLDFVLRSLPPEKLCRLECGDPNIFLNFNTDEDWQKIKSGYNEALL